MYHSSANDEDEERHDVVGLCKESLLSLYNHNNVDFACLNDAVSSATPSKPLKRSWPKKKRKSETAVDGRRVIRATGRKDRHSKVRTAKGPRDRRVRLSPPTAIQFYDVLDRLGFDRPSEALDWLIGEAKTAIDALGQQQTSTINFSDSTAPEYFPLSQHQPSNNDDCLSSAFSCSVDELHPISGFCSALNSNPQILDTNWEMARLQNLLSSTNARGGGGLGGGEGADCFPWKSLPPEQPIVVNNDFAEFDFAEFNFSDELWG